MRTHGPVIVGMATSLLPFLTTHKACAGDGLLGKFKDVDFLRIFENETKIVDANSIETTLDVFD